MRLQEFVIILVKASKDKILQMALENKKSFGETMFLLKKRMMKMAVENKKSL